MNKVIDSMLAHRSIRSYTDRTVSDEDLNSIIRAVQAAPNWVNLQLVSIIAVKNTDHRRRLAELCGNQVHIAEADRALLLDGAEPQILLMDPPYCSGGFQESGRSTGSIGTKRYDANGKEIKVTIANDTLSTRGYQQLMRSILKQFTGTVVYCFTDWRMWLYLYDVMEESGFGVKNMIVWNKKTPGMGMGWRTQHELIMFAHRTKLLLSP